MNVRRRTPLAAALLLGGLAGAPGAAGQCLETTVISPATGENDYGRSVAATGDLIAVGDPRLVEPGRVLTYRREGGAWVSETTLLAPSAAGGDQYGHAVAVGGTILVVGAYDADGNAGAAAVYRRTGASWVFEEELTASDGDAGDQFGWSVATDGTRVLVGARSDENDGTMPVGSAYVFRHDGAAWVEEAKLVDPNGATLDLFGDAVTIDGTTALVGAPNDQGPGVGAGAAHVFERTGNAWSHLVELKASDASSSERFGASLALAGDVAAVGAYLMSGASGAVYVFRYATGAWGETQKLTASDEEAQAEFGFEVAISAGGEVLAVGAPGDGGNGAGAAYLFADDGSDWSETTKVAPYGALPGARFGTSVAATAQRAVVGAPRESGAPGIADVFLVGTAECPAFGDLNDDGVVSFADLLLLVRAWGPCPPSPGACTADLSADGLVGGLDLRTLLVRWSR
jgi:hypothetical protein